MQGREFGQPFLLGRSRDQRIQISLTHYQQVLYALKRTDEIMDAIDDLIPAFPLP
ncbi:MAG: hypothetical protein RLP44_11225 [Aggregatilineales bacterium]